MPARLLRPENLHRLARVALLVFFGWLAGRYGHPYYGFTRFLQMDAEALAAALPELREAPIFTTSTATTDITTRNWPRDRR